MQIFILILVFDGLLNELITWFVFIHYVRRSRTD